MGEAAVITVTMYGALLSKEGRIRKEDMQAVTPQLGYTKSISGGETFRFTVKGEKRTVKKKLKTLTQNRYQISSEPGTKGMGLRPGKLRVSYIIFPP